MKVEQVEELPDAEAHRWGILTPVRYAQAVQAVRSDDRERILVRCGVDHVVAGGWRYQRRGVATKNENATMQYNPRQNLVCGVLSKIFPDQIHHYTSEIMFGIVQASVAIMILWRKCGFDGLA